MGLPRRGSSSFCNQIPYNLVKIRFKSTDPVKRGRRCTPIVLKRYNPVKIRLSLSDPMCDFSAPPVSEASQSGIQMRLEVLGRYMLLQFFGGFLGCWFATAIYGLRAKAPQPQHIEHANRVDYAGTSIRIRSSHLSISIFFFSFQVCASAAEECKESQYHHRKGKDASSQSNL